MVVKCNRDFTKLVSILFSLVKLDLVLYVNLVNLKMEWFDMPIKNILRNNGLKVILPVLLCSHTATAAAEWWDEMDVYVGAGVGQSLLSPPTSAGQTLYDRTGDSWKVMGGLDLNDHISIEGYYADLGRATTRTPDGDVSFRMQGADAILHYWARGEERAEGSVALYAKAGINYINTDMHFSRDATSNVLVGLGAELYLPYNFSVRLEAESYYADASLLSLNLVKRFGFRSKKPTPQKVAVVQKPIQVAPVPIVPVILDTDLDGVLDDIDQCQNTAKGSEVNEVGCVVYAGEVGSSIESEEFKFEVEQLQFNLNSAALTESSKVVLDEVADMLVTYGTMKIEVQAHSDSTGAASYNKKLSQKRAESVVKYLANKDIDPSRLTAVGYGEANPIADNKTVEGRAKNRRVELILLEK
jgi:OOP family OmpA-OmpF porin